MGKGEFNLPHLQGLPEYSMKEVAQHRGKADRWVVIDEVIYDISSWAKKHPGGEKIISNWAGQDASEAWYAFHPNKPYVSKFMKPLAIGRVKHEDELGSSGSGTLPIIQDFHKLRKTAEDMGLFKPSILFYSFILGHIIFFDLLGWLIMCRFGTSWVPFLIASVCLCIAQMQAGWAQHDYGHLSVFKSTKLNHWVQIFVINIIKGASADWWNFRHNNHHSKPNIVEGDPDIKLDMFFLVGKVLPIEWGKEKKGFMPYNHQHRYFYFLLPPLLLPLYFNYEIPFFLIKRKKWAEVFWMALFFVRWQIMFAPLLGFWGVFGLFLFVRFLESHWFVWATQMSHLPMDVDYDKQDDWVTAQLKATCNVEQSLFNDWWSGHLNFQIEHHLFPTMPRHNMHKVAPLCKSLCQKYGLVYQSKPLFQAFKDIVGSLESSGQLWYEAYTK